MPTLTRGSLTTIGGCYTYLPFPVGDFAYWRPADWYIWHSVILYDVTLYTFLFLQVLTLLPLKKSVVLPSEYAEEKIKGRLCCAVWLAYLPGGTAAGPFRFATLSLMTSQIHGSTRFLPRTCIILRGLVASLLTSGT